MKKATWLVVILLMAGNAFSQTLFTYGPYSVDKHEFIAAYQKNKSSVNDVKESLKDYLNLYTIFKLKVQAAKDLKMDTLPAQKADFQRFRSQIVNNFLWDSAKVQSLLQEAIDRSHKDIYVTALLVNTASKDSADLDEMLVKEVSRLNKHQLNKDELLKNWKAKDVQASQQDLGFITVFSLPYEIENIVYGLKSGQYSKPLRLGNNLYIFKNKEERPAAGTIDLAQILIASPEGFHSDRAQAKKLADSLYQLIRDGADFGELAKKYSNDRSTYMNDGKMAEFGVGKYSPDFESHAFSLQQDGEVSPPFATAFGYHIIKRISAHPAPQKQDDAYAYQFRQKLFSDPRIDIARQLLIEKIKPELGFTKHDFDLEDLWRVSDSSMLSNQGITSHGINYSSVLISFADGSEVKAGEWDTFLRNSGKVRREFLHESYRELWPSFTEQVILENYKKNLQEFSSTFAHQLQDFKDGNMLFEIMQNKVWLKAANDSAGLRNYYDQHAANYKWDKSADAVTFSCFDSLSAHQVREDLVQGKNWAELMQLFPGKVQADSGRFELAQIPRKGGQKIEAGSLTDMVVNSQDGTVSFAKILKTYPGGLPRTFDQARGLAVNDYQKVLEDKWVEQLREKYPVNVNKRVFNSVVRQAKK